MNIEELKRRVTELQVELEQVKARLLFEQETTTRTGKIIHLQIGRPYWVIGQRGQIYSVKFIPRNGDHLNYLNDLRLLFLSEEAAEKQRRYFTVMMRQMDLIDREDQ